MTVILDSDPSKNVWELNLDNSFLVTARKSADTPEQAKVLNEQFKHSMLVVGLSALRSHAIHQNGSSPENGDNEVGAAEWVAIASSALAPVVFPIMKFDKQITVRQLDRSK